MANTQAKVSATVVIKSSGGDIVLQGAHANWSGRVSGSYPLSITPTEPGLFEHIGVSPMDLQGSMGPLVYAGSNAKFQSPNCAWLVAWSVSFDGLANKVYVITADIKDLESGKVQMDQVLMKLNRSGSASRYYDPIVRSEASATIQSGNNAALAVIFSNN